MTTSRTRSDRLRRAFGACLMLAMLLLGPPAGGQEPVRDGSTASEVTAEAERAIEGATVTQEDGEPAAEISADTPSADTGAGASDSSDVEAPEPSADAVAATEEAAPAREIAEGDTGAALLAEGTGGSAFPPRLTDPGIPLDELTVRLVPLTKSELSTLAAEWLVIVRQKTLEMSEAQIAIMRTQGDVEDTVRERLTDLTAEREALFDRFSTVVDSWAKKGGEETAVADFRAYRNAIIIEETRTADVETLSAQALSWLTSRDGGVEFAINLGVIIASVVGLIFAARLARRVARQYIGHVKALSKLLQAFLVTVIYWIVLAFGLMIVLSALGVDITPVFALIGGASFILAFAFQDTLGNLAAGLMIMINRPFDEGDYVDVGGTAGTVRSVSIVATQVVTPDNQVIVIPNKNVWGSVITNVTASATRRVDLVFGISYGDDIGRAMAILKETIGSHPQTLSEPEPTIVVGALGASSVDILCRPWAKTEDYWTVYWDLTRQVKERFDAEGITIPYPQQDIHMHTVAPVQLSTVPEEGSPKDRAPEPAPSVGSAHKGTTASAIAGGAQGHDTADSDRG